MKCPQTPIQVLDYTPSDNFGTTTRFETHGFVWVASSMMPSFYILSISHSTLSICPEGIRLNFWLKPIFHLATLFARPEAKTRMRQRDWLKLVSEKIRREQVGTVPIFFVHANKFAMWKIGFTGLTFGLTFLLCSILTILPNPVNMSYS